MKRKFIKRLLRNIGACPLPAGGLDERGHAKRRGSLGERPPSGGVSGWSGGRFLVARDDGLKPVRHLAQVLDQPGGCRLGVACPEMIDELFVAVLLIDALQ